MNSPTRTTVIRTSALLALVLCTSAQAQAQGVRKCQIGGRAVFQAAPCHLEARVVATATAPAATDASATPKKKTLADVLRERDGADRTRPAVREFQSDGANVLRSRMGAV